MNTFVDNTNFNNESMKSTVTNAQLFGDKFAETFTPEASISIEEAKKRIDRLNEKPPVVQGVPNALLYYAFVGLSVYALYKILS